MVGLAKGLQNCMFIMQCQFVSFPTVVNVIGNIHYCNLIFDLVLMKFLGRGKEEQRSNQLRSIRPFFM